MASSEQGREPASDKEQWFASTHWSVVLAAGQGASPQADEALAKLCRTYWYPLYAYVRRQGHDEHAAEDLTQGFFHRVLAKNYLADVEREKGKFRSFLLAALKHFLANERDREQAVKRGGGKTFISLDDESAEERYRLEPVSNLTAEAIFERRWVLTLLERALQRLREEFFASGKAHQFDCLKPFLEGDANSGEYKAVAAELGMTPGAVAVAVHRLRQRYRELVRSEIAQTVASPADIDDEMRHLFAVLSGSTN